MCTNVVGYSLIWNVCNHASGNDFIKIQVGEYISTQKLMLKSIVQCTYSLRISSFSTRIAVAKIPRR